MKLSLFKILYFDNTGRTLHVLSFRQKVSDFSNQRYDFEWILNFGNQERT